ncbi:hypothetical protein BAE44_0003201, partial [Dichanthelium oligosanthes]
LRWLWLSRTAYPRLTFPARTDAITQVFFLASIKCEVGNGSSTLFWSDPWLEGACLISLLPDLVQAVPARRRITRTVASALSFHAWYSNLQGPLTVLVLAQFLQLAHLLQTVVLDPSRPDKMIWRWCPSGQYSCSSAYQAFFLGQTALASAKELWKPKHRMSFGSFSGWPFKTDAGRLIASFVVDFEQMPPAPSVVSLRSRLTTCYCTASTPGRSGSRFCVAPTGSGLPLPPLTACRPGGSVLGSWW